MAKGKIHLEGLTGDIARWARNGDVDMARLLCKWAGDDLWKGKKLEPVLAGYFARALERIGNGEDPKKVLHLTAPARRPNNKERNLEIAVDYWERRDAGETPKAAKINVGREWRLPAKLVERIVNEESKSLVRHEIEFRKKVPSEWINHKRSSFKTRHKKAK